MFNAYQPRGASVPSAVTQEVTSLPVSPASPSCQPSHRGRNWKKKKINKKICSSVALPSDNRHVSDLPQNAALANWKLGCEMTRVEVCFPSPPEFVILSCGGWQRVGFWWPTNTQLVAWKAFPTNIKLGDTKQSRKLSLAIFLKAHNKNYKAFSILYSILEKKVWNYKIHAKKVLHFTEMLFNWAHFNTIESLLGHWLDMHHLCSCYDSIWFLNMKNIRLAESLQAKKISQSDALLGARLSNRFPRSSKLTLARERQRHREMRKSCGFGYTLPVEAVQAGDVGKHRPQCQRILTFWK